MTWRCDARAGCCARVACVFSCVHAVNHVCMPCVCVRVCACVCLCVRLACAPMPTTRWARANPRTHISHT
jgi:hypothetical protein